VPQLRTADGERLHAVVDGDAADWVVLAHGFTGYSAKPMVRRIAERLARSATVLSFDARGHGRSSGLTTLGDREVLDVDAAVAYARAAGARSVATLGWSMGGAAVLRHAALRGERVGGAELASPPDAVVAVSTTSAWTTRQTATASMRRVHWLVETPGGRLVTRVLLRTRVSAAGWDPLPLSPLDCVARIAPLPLLLVHGDLDAYVQAAHPRALAAAAGEPCELWLEPGYGHAELAATPELVDRIARHLGRVLT
jgi:pimeloyl-ACP methyl ester carboxylesterase